MKHTHKQYKLQRGRHAGVLRVGQGHAARVVGERARRLRAPVRRARRRRRAASRALRLR